jgi:hypothetical protein
MVLLVHPPVSKPCEPPAGIARLAGALKGHGIEYGLIDANLEGLMSLLKVNITAADTWTRRALRNVSRNVDALRDPSTYASFDRYRRAMADLNRILAYSPGNARVHAGLCNYDDERLSPVRSDDLLATTANPHWNPFYPYFSERLDKAIEGDRPSLVGFSLNYLSQALTTFAMIGFVKERFPGIKVALGGGLVTSWVRNPSWINPFAGLVDHIVAGPGEEALVAMAGGSGGRPADSLPVYGDLPTDSYLSPGMILPYSSSVGCYWSRCSFCPEQAEGNTYGALRRATVESQLATLVRTNRPILVHILDNAISPAFLKALIKNPPGAPWYGFTRFSELLADYDFCLALRDAGCVMLKLGLESGDEAVLNLMRKGISLETASMALRNLRNAGIGTYVYLLFGTPYETEAKARKTMDFVVKHNDAISFLNVAVFSLPINSPDAKGLQTRPFYEGDLSLYTDFVHPSGWSRRQARKFLDRELKRHPAVAPILARDPPFFTSNHAPFFVLQRNK